MFGMIIGTLSLIGFVKVWRAGRHGYGRHNGGPRRWMLRRLFERLDTSPGQEKVVLDVINDAETKAYAFRASMQTARVALANSMRGEHFDGAQVDETFTTQQAQLDELKASMRAGMAKIHEALNDAQRKELAQLIEFGPRGMHGGWHHGRHGRHHGHRGMGPMSQGGPGNTVSL